MKKYLIASLIALTVALVGASSVNADFKTNLTVGSTGTDVSALQAWLIGKGFDIPAISSGAAKAGYFGSQTKAAVSAYQKSVGLPSYGFFGPLTQAKVNGGTVGTVVVAGCPIGFDCTPKVGTTPATTVAGAIVNDGTDGSLSVSLSSFAGNNTIKKGETKDMVAVKLQATAGAVSVTRFDVRFNTRPWLYFGSIQLKDSAGTVIATKNLSSSADATEITVGSDYLVRFEGINTTVTPGTDKTLVVSGTVLSTTDKLTSDVSVIVSIPNSSIRTINGKGYTDSLGLGTVAQSGTTGRTMTLSSTGSTANILGKLSAVSPDNRIVTTSTNGETAGIVLGKFDFKSENRSSTINTLTFTLKDNAGNRSFSTMYKRLYITDGTKTVQVDSVATSSVFSNLTFDLAQDTWKTLTITADIADQDDFVSGAMGSTTITINSTNIVGIDSNYSTVTASGANVVTSNDVTFLPAGASVTSPKVTVKDVDNGTSASTKKTVSFEFAFNNTGTTDLYISRDPYLAVATSSTIATTTSFTSVATTTVFSLMTAGDSMNGDTSAVFIVPASRSRSITISGLIDTTRDTTAGTKSGELKITKVYFADDTTGVSTIRESNVNFGLDKLTTSLIAF